MDNTDKLTIAAWIYPYEVSTPGLNRQYSIIGEWAVGENHQFSIMDDSLYFTFWNDGKEYFFKGNSGKIEANRWYFVAVTYDGIAVKLYINGELDKYFGMLGKIEGHDSTLFIGSWNGLDDWFNGKIDDVFIFSRSLSWTEIIRHYEYGVQPQ